MDTLAHLDAAPRTGASLNSLIWSTLFSVTSEGGPRENLILLEDLLVELQSCHGKAVRVEGVLCLEFEGTTLWVSSQEQRAGNCGRALWVDLPPIGMGLPKELERFDKRRVALTGTLATDFHGHMGLFPGALFNVKDIAKPSGGASKNQPLGNT